MPRPRIFGYIALIAALFLSTLIIYSFYIVWNEQISYNDIDLGSLSNFTYYSISIPITLVAMGIVCTGFWIGWTILTIKVVPPMPEIVEKRDFSKVKAFFLCLITLGLGILLIYGLYIKNFWALAIPAAVISLVILGAVFWVGIAIITTRTTLPEDNKQQ